MAHLVQYWADGGDTRLAPTVSNSVHAKARTSPADVMLVSALLNMYFAPVHRLPHGARHMITAGGTFTAQTKLFIVGFQQDLPDRLNADGNVSPLPPGLGYAQLINYTMFALFKLVSRFESWDEGDGIVLKKLKALPHLHDLGSMIQEAPPPTPLSEGGRGAGISEGGR
jgi:hypothetical protein